ncbi:MAG TPA: glycosyltransferase family 2 protein [Anaerolineales bacterium]|nr:glycosyltransferase family 2 protein [Anaerolineales bacterium]HNC07271.1 glycosyltransferase family 2 protein [Anaerolineales bacterium]
MTDRLKHKPHISVIIPAFNEGAGIGGLIERIRVVLQSLDEYHEIIIIDDGSSDATAENAKQAGARVITHPYNIGNGAAVKTGIRHAKGSILVTMDADGQHNPEDIPRLVNRIGAYDMVVGSRNSDSDTAAHRDMANLVFNSLASYVSGRKIEDLTSGFRAVKARIARQFLYLFPNKFSYPSTITLSVVRAGYSLGYESIRFPKRNKNTKSKIKPLQDGFRFLMIILRIAVFYAPLKVFVPLSFIIFLLGVAYGLLRIFLLSAPYGQTSALLMSTAALTFLVGLVSEQIAQLRFDRSESDKPIEEDE